MSSGWDRRMALRPSDPRSDLRMPTHCSRTFDVRIPSTFSGLFEGICCPTGVASPSGMGRNVPRGRRTATEDGGVRVGDRSADGHRHGGRRNL
jgi:hypothetical protein